MKLRIFQTWCIVINYHIIVIDYQVFYERNFYGIIDYKNGVIDYTSSVLKVFNTASLTFLDVIDYKISQICFYTVIIDYISDVIDYHVLENYFLHYNNRLPCAVIDYHCHWTVYINLKCDFRIKHLFSFLQNKSCDMWTF